MYRCFLSHIRGWLAAVLHRRPDERFYHETRVWYYVSFFTTRWRHPHFGSVTSPALRSGARARESRPSGISVEA
jgi:hypothetical protein